MTLSKEHAEAGVEGIVNSPRAFHCEPLRVGVAPRVHIGVTDFAPEMWGTLLHRPHELGDAQRIGQPLQLDAVCVFQFEQPLVGDKSVPNSVMQVGSILTVAAVPSRSFLQNFSRRIDKPARSRSQVSDVMPSARKTCFSTLAVGVFGNSSMMRI